MKNLKNLKKAIKTKILNSGPFKINNFFNNKYTEAEKLITERAKKRKI